MVWALMSLDLLERLVTDRRWSQARVAKHLDSLLVASFVAPV